MRTPRRTTRSRHWHRLIFAALLGVLVTACGARNDPEQWSDEELRERVRGRMWSHQPGDLVPMRVGLLNYTDEYIGEVYVDRSWAANVPRHTESTGAGSAATPAFYDPDYGITVRWQPESLWEQDRKAYHSREIVPEPPQKNALNQFGWLWVAFFPDGEVKLYPTAASPGQPDFPDGLKNPKAACVEQRPDDVHSCYSPHQYHRPSVPR